MLPSPLQKKIIQSPDGHYLVVASAGSGKTRVLTERVRHLLVERNVRSRILALTFTNKAAEEMRHRLRDLPDLSDRTYIGTIHSFCQTIIEAHGRSVGYERMPAILEREADRIAMLEEAMDGSPDLRKFLLRQGDPKASRKFLYEILEKISGCKRDWELFQKISSRDWPSEREAQAFKEYQDRLASQGVIDFDDILLLALRILIERPSIAALYQSTYRYLCVDEAQDLNGVQYSLIKALGENSQSVLLVGDPNQAIYGFNGSSDRFMMEEFPKDFKVETIALRENYRSSKAVIRAANALYPGSIDLESAALEGEFKIVACADEAHEASWVVEKIASLLESGHPDIDGPVSLDRMVVLARNRYVFGALQEQLKTENVSFHLRQAGGGMSLESDFGKVFDLGIRLLVNPNNDLQLREFTRLIGAPTPSTLAPSLDGIKAVCDSARADWGERLGVMKDAWGILAANVNQFTKALEMLESFFGSEKAMNAIDAEEKALAMADVEFLRRIWATYTQRVGRDSRSLAQLRNQMATAEIVPNIAGTGLMLAPVHTVKGLEFDVVFVMGLVEGGFPDYRAVKAGGTALAEEQNDAFVAITRAKRLLFLTWPQAKFMPWDRDNRVNQYPSRYLTMIEEATSGHGTLA